MGCGFEVLVDSGGEWLTLNTRVSFVPPLRPGGLGKIVYSMLPSYTDMFKEVDSLTNAHGGLHLGQLCLIHDACCWEGERIKLLKLCSRFLRRPSSRRGRQCFGSGYKGTCSIWRFSTASGYCWQSHRGCIVEGDQPPPYSESSVQVCISELTWWHLVFIYEWAWSVHARASFSLADIKLTVGADMWSLSIRSVTRDGG